MGDPLWLCGYDAWLPTVSSKAGVSPGRFIKVWHCGGLSVVLLQLKDPLQLIMKRKEFLPGSGFPSHRNMT